MRINQSQAKKWGIICLVSAIVLLIGGGIVVFEPLQASFIKLQKKPSFGGTALGAILAGFIISLLTYVGFALSVFSYQKPSDYVEFELKDLIRSNWLIWLAVWTVAFLIVLFVWRSDLP